MKQIRKSTQIFFAFILSISYSMAQQITGDWSGKLNVQGQEIPLIFHISKEKDTYSATMDSPMQGAAGIPVEKVTYTSPQLKLELPQAGIVYEATVEKDQATGTFKQGGMEFPLSLTRGTLEKPGNPELPSTEEELKALAAKESGNYKYSVKDYFAKPLSSSFKLSPKGTYMSYREKDDNLKNHVYVKNVVTGKVTKVIEEGEELIRGYGWANDNRLIYVMDKGGNEDYHLFAVDITGKNQKELTPYEGVKVNILANLKEDKDHMIISMNKNNPQVFDPYKININTGEIVQLYENKDLQNPIMGYEFDKDGNLRGFSRLKDGINSELYYATKEGDYQLIKSTSWDDTFSILNFDYASKNPHEAYVLSNLASDKAEIYKYDLAKNKIIDKLYSNSDYDASSAALSRNRNWELDYFMYEGEKNTIYSCK